MRELTIHELDAQLAEQLPARELMGSTCGCRSGFTYTQGSYNGNTTGLVAIGVANGNFNGWNVIL